MWFCCRLLLKHYTNLQLPRDEELDKPEERIENPAKLFRVQRIKPLKGRPFWEKKILAELGIADVVCISMYLDLNRISNLLSVLILFQKRSNMTIVKNIPEMNNRLMKIKHLIRIDPITFPYGEPTRNDVNHTYLTPTGECIVTKDISIDPKRIEATDKFINDPTRLDKDTLSNDALKKWNDPFI